jgi:hypothetical protein
VPVSQGTVLRGAIATGFVTFLWLFPAILLP